MSECHLCMGPCDPTYHASSKRIRAWMIRKISDAQAAPPVIVPKSRPHVTGMGVTSLGLPTPEARRRASRLGGRAQGRR